MASNRYSAASCGKSRRVFLQQTVAATAVLATRDFAALAGARPGQAGQAGTQHGQGDSRPWYRRAVRWGQTNITERDPTRYDIAWWREYWRRTQVQGVIINAGGIVAYYPSRFPLHRRAQFLGDRDLLGELTRAAHEAGLAVLARMDSNRAHEEFYRAHPDWFAVDGGGKPYRAGESYVSCIHGPYYEEWIPGLLREIAERYRPEGFTDNSWSGLGRGSICYCAQCRKKFREHAGHDLPLEKNWDDPIWREWVGWNYTRRLEIWDFYNRVTRAAGGEQCLWVGMNSGSVSAQGGSFRDLKEICARAEILLLDHQARSDASGFQQNAETGKLVHGLLGWDKLAPESMALYQAGRPTYRLSAKPEPEARLWMLEGFAGGIQPWWHHVGAFHEDRRAYRTVEPLLRWHKANEEFLIDRRPSATVGVVWSQKNTDFYGRDDAELLVEQPWRGITQALIRARIPYLPVHADHVERDTVAYGMTLLILPNFGVMTDEQVAGVRRFVDRGGGLLATGESGLCNEWGEPRADFALADLFGAHTTEKRAAPNDPTRRRWAAETQHTYLRLTPAPGARGERRNTGDQPPATGVRHRILRGFEETDILPFGGMLPPLRVEAGPQVLLTFIPAFPIYPPETAWMREPRTDIPGLILNELPGATPSEAGRKLALQTSTRGRVAFLPADLDRRFARDNLPDHGDLLANLVRWAARDNIPLSVEGSGLIDCHLYRQRGRLILHLVNLTSAGTWRQPVHELIPVGPLRITVKLPDGVKNRPTRLLVSSAKLRANFERGWAHFEIRSILDHEVVVVG
jgi:hypothetical protein